MSAANIDLIQIGLMDQPEKEGDQFFDKGKFSNSGIIYERKITSGLNQVFDDVYKLSVFPSVWWPKQKDLFFVKGHQISEREKIIGYLNLVLFKDNSIARNIVREIAKLVKSGQVTRHQKINIFFSITNFYCALCLPKIKELLPNSRIVLNILDVPGLIEFCKNPIERLFKERILSRFKELIRDYADGFVLLSEFMSDILPIKGKPTLIVPGICSEFLSTDPLYPHQFCYAGVISDEYLCTKVLIEAFRETKLSFPDAKLVICGPGRNNDLMNALEEGVIEYLGNLLPEEADAIQESSGILINLRKNLPGFRYSFPSKITNYLSSGRPIIQSELDCIPGYIREALVMINDVNVDSVAYAMKKCLNLSAEEKQIILKKESEVCNELSVRSVAVKIKRFFEMLD